MTKKRKSGRPVQGYRSSRERERRQVQAAASERADSAVPRPGEAPEPTAEEARAGEAEDLERTRIDGAEEAEPGEAEGEARAEPQDEDEDEVEVRERARPVRTSRAPTTRRKEQPPPPRGIFSSLRAPSPFPRFRETMGRGLSAVAGSPPLVLTAFVLVLLMWLGLLAAGLDHAPQGLTDLLAVPPVSSFFDLNVAVTMVGLTTSTILYVLGFTVVRAVAWALLTSMVVEALETGRVSRSAVVRAIRVFPPMLGIVMMAVGTIFLAQILRGFLGAALGGLAFMAGLVGGLLLLVFAPVAVVRERVSAREAVRRSARAAMMPGGRHLGMSFLYFLAAFFAFTPTGAAFVINPSLGQWVFVLAGTLVHLVFLAGFAYRYMAVEDQIPPPARRAERTPLLGRR